MKRHLATCLVVTAMAVGVSLHADDLWTSSLKLVGGQCNGMQNGNVGKNMLWGVSGEGVYPFARTHLLACEAGYRSTLSNDATASSQEITSKTTGFLVGAYYRYRFDETLMNGWLEGLYLQGGARLNAMQAELKTSTGTTKGPRVTQVKPLFGVGFQFTDKISMGLDFTSLTAERPAAANVGVNGARVTSSVMEVSLGLHF